MRYLAAALWLITASAAWAQTPLEIGVLNDRSGMYADLSGEGSVSDPILPHATVRIDGRVLRPFYLFEVKSSAESKGLYDYYKLVREIPADDAARPLNEGGCPLVH